MTVSGPAVSGDIGWRKVKYTTPEGYPVFEKHPGSAVERRNLFDPSNIFSFTRSVSDLINKHEV